VCVLIRKTGHIDRKQQGNNLIEHIERDSIYCDDIFFEIGETPTDCRIIEESSIFFLFEQSQRDKI